MNTINLSFALSGLLMIVLGYFVRKSKGLKDPKRKAEGEIIMLLGAISILIAEFGYFNLFDVIRHNQDKVVVVLMLFGFLAIVFGGFEIMYPFHKNRESAKKAIDNARVMIIIGIIMLLVGFLIDIKILDLIISVLRPIGFS